MKKIVRWLDVNFEAILMVIFFTLMLGLVTLQVILRFLFQGGIPWGEEVARILFVWTSFASFGYLTRNNRHVRISFLREKLSKKMQKVLLMICDLAFLIFTVFGLKAVILLCMDAEKYNDTLIAVPWSQNVLYLAGVLGFFMMVLRNIQVIYWKYRHWNSELDEFINYEGSYYENNQVCFLKKEE